MVILEPLEGLVPCMPQKTTWEPDGTTPEDHWTACVPAGKSEMVNGRSPAAEDVAQAGTGDDPLIDMVAVQEAKDGTRRLIDVAARMSTAQAGWRRSAHL